MSLKVRLFKCFLDAAVSEQIARRIAMKQATDNASEMIRQITRQYNRARQANITKENPRSPQRRGGVEMSRRSTLGRDQRNALVNNRTR
jgi:hypothetical protein